MIPLGVEDDDMVDVNVSVVVLSILNIDEVIFYLYYTKINIFHISLKKKNTTPCHDPISDVSLNVHS